jgi:hypothetical protein
MGILELIKSITGRELKVGTPRLWGTLALGAATTSALTTLWITGVDLLGDWREGVSDWPEYLAVTIAGLVSAGLLLTWISLAANPLGRSSWPGSAAKPTVIWDREIDRVPKAKGRT